MLDLFAGSGAMGLEALSRGAASCVFVESSRGPAGRSTPTSRSSACTRPCSARTPSARSPPTEARYDLILCDPPYDYDRGDALAPHLERVLAPNGLLVYETAAREQPEIPGLDVRTSRKYGSARLTLFEQ